MRAGAVIHNRHGAACCAGEQGEPGEGDFAEIIDLKLLMAEWSGAVTMADGGQFTQEWLAAKAKVVAMQRTRD
jgi:hypothetical protein